MRITVVTGPFYPVPPAPCGAVERIWHDLAEVFAARGHEVTVLCRHWPGQNRDETISGVRYVRRTRLSHTRSIYWDLVQDMWYSLRMWLKLPRSDITVTNVFWLPALIGWMRTRRAGRVVVHVARFPKGQMKLYSRAARFAPCSQAIVDAIVAERPEYAPRVRAFPNPIRTDRFTPPPNGRINNGTTTLLYTGRVNPEKGLHLLAEAFGQLRLQFPKQNLRLRIVGPWLVEQGGGGQEYADRLRAGGAEVPGPLNDPAALAEELRSADLYCYPTLAEKGEASPVAPLEAMATGLVPVVSDLPQFRDYLEPGKTGIVFDHRSPDAATKLAQAIASLLEDPQKRAHMGKQAAEVGARFSNEKVADLYLNDFAELLRCGE
jgi:glycosyltransferase involved in cell wall biosynthesis